MNNELGQKFTSKKTRSYNIIIDIPQYSVML